MAAFFDETPMLKKDDENVISSTNELEKAYFNEMAKESVKAPEKEETEKVETQKWKNLNWRDLKLSSYN